MGTMRAALTPADQSFITVQPVFFVATAATEGRVNVSPKGGKSLRVLAPDRIAWLNLTGSGNETAAHVLRSPRITMLFCSFAEPPMILRLYGRARIHSAGEALPPDLAALFPGRPAARQIFDVALDGVRQSCGWGVPVMNLEAERCVSRLEHHFRSFGPEQMRAYWRARNRTSIDGFPSDIDSP